MKPTGKKVRCILAKTQFYEKGAVYEEYTDGIQKGVKGSDGLFDSYTRMLSKFEEVKEG